MKTTQCIIYGSGDESQVVKVLYDFSREGSMFSPTVFEVNEVIIETPLSISPSDLYNDVQHWIAIDLGVCDSRVRIECEIEEAVTLEMMFV